MYITIQPHVDVLKIDDWALKYSSHKNDFGHLFNIATLKEFRYLYNVFFKKKTGSDISRNNLYTYRFIFERNNYLF